MIFWLIIVVQVNIMRVNVCLCGTSLCNGLKEENAAELNLNNNNNNNEILLIDEESNPQRRSRHQVQGPML